MSRKFGALFQIFDLMSHFRFKPELVGKWLLTPQSKRIRKFNVEK